MPNEPVFKLNVLSLRLVVAFFAVMLLMLGLTAAGIFDVANWIIVVAKLTAVVIFFIEISVLTILKGVLRDRQLGFITGIEFFIGAFVLLDVVLTTFFQFAIPALSQFSGWILFIFGIAFFIEAFLR